MKLLKFHLSIFLITVCLFDLGNLHAQTDDATAILSSLDSAKAIEEANPSVAFRIATRALEKAKDLGDTTLIAQAHALCGNALFSKELFSQALLRYQLALSGFQQNGDSLGIARLEMSIARCEIFDGRYDDAIQRLSKSLNIFKQG